MGRDRADPQVFLDREAGEDQPSLGHQREPALDALVRRGQGEIGSVEDDAAGRRGHQPGDAAHQGRLAGAVAADERRDRALGDIEGDRLQHPDFAIAGGDGSDFQHRRHFRARPR